MTQTILTPTIEFCQTNKSLIVKDYESNRIRLGNTDLTPEKIIPICVKVP